MQLLIRLVKYENFLLVKCAKGWGLKKDALPVPGGEEGWAEDGCLVCIIGGYPMPGLSFELGLVRNDQEEYK